MKVCTECGVSKPETEFTLRRDKRSEELRYVREAKCRACRNAYHRRRRQAEPEKIKAYAASARGRKASLISRGVLCTLEEVQYLLEREHCDTCGVSVSGKDKHLDHNHATGRLRGVLCSHCNHALGHVKDSITTLLCLVAYLEGDDEEPLSHAHATALSERRAAHEAQAAQGAKSG